MEISNRTDNRFTGIGSMSGSHFTGRTAVNRVLITDRSLLSLSVMDFISSTLDIEIEIVVFPDDISSMLKAEKFDAILLDLSIPNIEPLLLINYILRNSPDSKVIIVYDNKSLEMAIEVLSNGSFSLLKKPYSISQFVRILREANVISPHEEESIIEYSSSNPFPSKDDLLEDSLKRIGPLTDEPLKTEPVTTKPFKTEPGKDFLDKYHFMVENSQDVIYTIDDLGIFTFVNSRVETLLGFSKSELIGKHFLVLVYHEDIEDANAHFYGDSNTDNAQKSFELRFKSRQENGEPILFDIRCVTIPKEMATMEKYRFAHGDEPGITAGTYCVARDIMERRKIEDMISHTAHHDYLTGLPDKILINDRIDSAIAQSKRSSTSFALMFLDLDGFKEVNDTYGHGMGDSLLQAVGARIKGCIREVDTLARVGGDEFMLLISQINDHPGVSRIAEKIIREIQKPYNLKGCELMLSASIGIAMYPGDGDSRDALISSADMSMYHIKRKNKNGFQFFSEM